MDDIDASDLLALVPALEHAQREGTNRVYAAAKKAAHDLRDGWKRNARQTAPPHGKHYPRAITAEQIPVSGEVLWEVGPESHLPQGGMGRGFEFGSIHQPPHWDGTNAAVKVEPEFLKAIEDALKDLL